MTIRPDPPDLTATQYDEWQRIITWIIAHNAQTRAQRNQK